MSKGSTRQLWLVPVLLITVIATALGGLLTRDLYADSAPPAPEPVLPGPPSSIPPSQQPGPVTVQGTLDATAHPLYETFRGLLQNYFEAINLKDYKRWAGTVTDERLTSQPEEEWQADYSTTQDGSIVLYRIESDADDTARVLLQFTSTQAPELGPPELRVGCIHWNVVWAFARNGGEWKLAAGSASASPQHEEC